MRFIIDVIRALVRIIGVALLLFGVFALGMLGVVLTAGDGRAGDLLGKVWFQHDPFSTLLNSPSIQLVQVFFERKLGMPQLWDPGVTTLLNWPAWLALSSVGLACLIVVYVLFAITRRRRRAAA